MRITIAVLGLFIFISTSAFAHSTAGRLKINLVKKNPTVDDFAYFTEPYVTHMLFKDKFKLWKMRFFVKSFDGIKRNKETAILQLTIRDLKRSSSFNKRLEFVRQKNGQWIFVDENNEKIPVFTYVKKWPYYYEKYIFPACCTGFTLLIIYGFFHILRKKKENAEAKKV